jgi:site-specific DNA recombinase
MAAPFVPAPGPGLRGDGDALVPWAERTAHGDRRAPGRGMLRFVFYGRVSTEDWQDPLTSRARQREQAEALVRGHGVIVAELFDVGEPRTVVWARRPQAAALVTALADPDRGWDAVVIGEYERAFYGSQYAAMAPLFEHYGVQLWMPETGGGGRLRIRARREDDDGTGLVVQAEDHPDQHPGPHRDGRPDPGTGPVPGGRPPYGYQLTDAGPHPNKAHAAWGRRAHRLDPDPATAPVVRWIFAQRLAGHPVARIARALNEAGVPCPSAADPGRNTHRTGASWTLGTLTTILENPRYTGRQVWNRQRTDTELADRATSPSGIKASSGGTCLTGGLSPAGRRTRRWSARTTSSPCRTSAPPAARSRKDEPVLRRYLLAGLLACGVCGRRMESAWSNAKPAYRCRHGRTSAMAPDPSRPKNTYVREDELLPHLPALYRLFTTPAVRARRRTRAGADVRDTVSPGEVIRYLRTHEITLTWNPAAAALQASATQTAKTLTVTAR